MQRQQQWRWQQLYQQLHQRMRLSIEPSQLLKANNPNC
jgi:hypothetical protein